MFQHVLVITLRSKAFYLRRSDLVNGFAELLNDMEAVQNIQSIRGFLLDHFNVRFPHVRAYEFQFLATFLAKVPKEPQQHLCLTFFPHEQQPPYPHIDLIYKRQILMSFPILYLVNSDGRDPIQLSMLQTIFYNLFNRTKYNIPCRAK